MRRILQTMIPASLLIIALGVSPLSGCAALAPLGKDDEARRAAKVTLTAYEATQQAMLIYGRLPTCDETVGVIKFCKNGKLWVKIKAVEKAATTAIAEATPVLNGTEPDAGQLLAALSAIENVKNAVKEAQETMKGDGK